MHHRCSMESSKFGTNPSPRGITEKYTRNKDFFPTTRMRQIPKNISHNKGNFGGTGVKSTRVIIKNPLGNHTERIRTPFFGYKRCNKSKSVRMPPGKHPIAISREQQ